MNWALIRENFPAARNGVFLNSAANSPLHKKVYQAVCSYWEHLYQNGEWDYWKSQQCLERVRALMGDFINAKADDIGFGINSSHNMNLISMMLKEYLGKSQKNKILLCSDEFPSSYFPWEFQGYEVVKIESKQGYFDERDFAKKLDARVGAVVLSHVQFATGFRSNLKQIGQWCRDHGLFFIVNATQSLGSFPIDVKSMHIDALVASCHKRMGAGTGLSVLYVNEHVRELGRFPLAGWWSVPMVSAFRPLQSEIKRQTSAMETGVIPFATVWALEAALQVVRDIGIERIAQRTWELSTLCEAHLCEANLDLKLLSWRDRETCWEQSHNSGNILYAHPRGQELFEYLNQQKVFIGSRAGGVRIAIHYFNNSADFERLITMIREFK